MWIKKTKKAYGITRKAAENNDTAAFGSFLFGGVDFAHDKVNPGKLTVLL